MSSGARRFGTRAVHAGLEPDPSYRSVIPPIHQTSTYAQPAPGEYVEDYDYARSANPTRTALERALGELEGGRAVTFASGMAAEHGLLTVVAEAGAHVVLPGDLYGGTYRLVDKVLTRWGLAYDLVDQTDLDAVAGAIRPETRLVWVESPTNPTLDVIDVEGVVAVARAAPGHPLVAVDNTFATPANQQPLALGADFAVHSTTKYLGGHSDTVGGRRRDQGRGLGGAAALRAERRRGGPRALRLLPRPSRPADAAPAHGRARGLRGGLRRGPAGGPADERRPLARLQRDGELPAPRRAGARGPRPSSSRWPSRSAAWSRSSRSRRP